MKIINKFKIFIWKLTSSNNCPLCKGKIKKHGFAGHNERYTCPNLNCEFGEQEE
jgi:hypothetical protein